MSIFSCRVELVKLLYLQNILIYLYKLDVVIYLSIHEHTNVKIFVNQLDVVFLSMFELQYIENKRYLEEFSRGQCTKYFFASF